MEKNNRFINLRNSKQRERILELLKSSDLHPTADWLFEQLKKDFPKLSLGTVYRNLNILYEQGLIKKIHYGSTFDRFEANISQHYHLICKKCGAIIDFNLDIFKEINSKARQVTNFDIHSHNLEFYGICNECKIKEKL